MQNSQILEEVWRCTESLLLEVQCEVSTVSDDLGFHVICRCWSTVFSEVHSQHRHLSGLFYCAWLAIKLAWPENLWGSVKSKMRDTRPNNADDLKAAIKATWASMTPEQCHKYKLSYILSHTEYNEEWNVFSAFNPSKCTHLEQSWTWTHNLGLPRVSSPTLYPLGHDCTAAQADCLHVMPHWCRDSCKRRANQVLSA